MANNISPDVAAEQATAILQQYLELIANNGATLQAEAGAGNDLIAIGKAWSSIYDQIVTT